MTLKQFFVDMAKTLKIIAENSIKQTHELKAITKELESIRKKTPTK